MNEIDANIIMEENIELTQEDSKENLEFWLKFIGDDLEKVFAVTRMRFVEDKILTEEDYQILFNKCEEILNNKKRSM